MPTIRDFTLTYDALNDFGTFSEGDTITGTLKMHLDKEAKVESLFVKAKGDANVHWSERHGDRNHSYSAHRRFFKLKQFLIPENTSGTVLPPGSHIYKFSFKLPTGSMPSSFRGSHGKIVYLLEAKLARGWKMDRTVEKEICFVSKAFPNIQHLFSQQVGSETKTLGIFSKGTVHMDAIIDKQAYAPGDTVSIVVKINNSSSKDMTPKISLNQHVVYRANGHTKHHHSVVGKIVGDCINEKTQKDIRHKMTISPETPQTIQNCDVLSVQYHLKVYLDISFSFDPEIVFPVVIIPRDLTPGYVPSAGPSHSDFTPPAFQMGPYPPGATGGQSNSDFPPPAAHLSTPGYPAAPAYSAPPPVYPGYPSVPGTSGMYPAPPTHMSGGYNPPPQQPYPYGSPFSASSSSSMLHPPPSAPAFHPPSTDPAMPQFPSAPTMFNTSPNATTNNLMPSAPMMNTDFLSQSDEAPPSYSVLFPSSTTENSDAK
ncbi:arrestin domain-containing protein 3-like [Sphaeramia orbicularis]|uniref:Arrestin domain-containing protein 3-like n=1 Tax=Sphaeramia orbicularis TaxID=375764 RepID=A0A673CNM5_9TELE|nr:arrestin domain-containing protein 3-like [Sphaeramia orbicularis]